MRPKRLRRFGPTRPTIGDRNGEKERTAFDSASAIARHAKYCAASVWARCALSTLHLSDENLFDLITNAIDAAVDGVVAGG
jgi:hypothetical protein